MSFEEIIVYFLIGAVASFITVLATSGSGK